MFLSPAEVSTDYDTYFWKARLSHPRNVRQYVIVSLGNRDLTKHDKIHAALSFRESSEQLQLDQERLAFD